MLPEPTRPHRVLPQLEMNPGCEVLGAPNLDRIRGISPYGRRIVIEGQPCTSSRKTMIGSLLRCFEKFSRISTNHTAVSGPKQTWHVTESGVWKAGDGRNTRRSQTTPGHRRLRYRRCLVFCFSRDGEV